MNDDLQKFYTEQHKEELKEQEKIDLETLRKDIDNEKDSTNKGKLFLYGFYRNKGR